MGTDIYWKMLYIFGYFCLILCIKPIYGLNSKTSNKQMGKAEYDNLLIALRDNWQSPIGYLKKRGYIPEYKNGKIQSSALAKAIAAIPCIEIASHIRRQAKMEDVLNSLYDKSSTNNDEYILEDYSTKPNKKPGFLTNIKDKFVELFLSNNDKTINSNKKDDKTRKYKYKMHHNNTSRNRYGSRNDYRAKLARPHNQQRQFTEEEMRIQQLEEEQELKYQQKEQELLRQQLLKQQQQRREQQKVNGRNQDESMEDEIDLEIETDNENPSLVTSLSKVNAKMDDLIKQLELLQTKLQMNPKGAFELSHLRNIDIVNDEKNDSPKNYIDDADDNQQGIIYYEWTRP